MLPLLRHMRSVLQKLFAMPGICFWHLSLPVVCSMIRLLKKGLSWFKSFLDFAKWLHSDHLLSFEGPFASNSFCLAPKVDFRTSKSSLLIEQWPGPSSPCDHHVISNICDYKERMTVRTLRVKISLNFASNYPIFGLKSSTVSTKPSQYIFGLGIFLDYWVVSHVSLMIMMIIIIIIR